MAALDILDISVFVIYFVLVIITGLCSMFASKQGTVNGFFLAGRHMTWLPIGLSLFASNIGSEHFIGLAGSGAASGIGIGAFELNACVLLQLLGWVFLPVYMASGIVTLPQYMMRRFGGQRIQMYLAVLSLLLYIFTKISVNLYSGILFIRTAFDWNAWLSIMLLLGLTAAVTVTGGLTAVIYTDSVQALIMVLGSTVLTVAGLHRIGGISGLVSQYPQAVANSTRQQNSTCGLPSPYSFRLLRPLNDRDMPWLGFLLGQTPASVWYWCADQLIVQRALAARSLSHAQGGTLFAGFIKLTPLFIMVLPGMISRVLYPELIACSDPDVCEQKCGSRSGCSNLAFPHLVVNLLPPGLRGLLMSVMVSALVTDLTSIFNSASTLFTIDVYSRLRPSVSAREQLLVGKLSVIVLVCLSIAWIPVVTSLQGSQLFVYIQDVCANLAPPIATVYVAAILWKRANETGAFYSLLWGFAIGFVRLTVTSLFPEAACGDLDSRPKWVKYMPHYMYFAVFSTASTFCILLLLSLCTDPPTEHQVRNLTVFSLDRRVNRGSDEEGETLEMRHISAGLTGDQEVEIYNAQDGHKQSQHLHHHRVSLSRCRRLCLLFCLCMLLSIAAALYLLLSLLPPLINSTDAYASSFD